MKEPIHRRRFLLDMVFILIVLQAATLILVYPTIAIQFPSATTILPSILNGLYYSVDNYSEEWFRLLGTAGVIMSRYSVFANP